MSTPPAACATPQDLPPDASWSAAVVPGTVARSVRPGTLDGHPDYDARDWWYRTSFSEPEGRGPGPHRVQLRLDGLATHAEVWVNGTLVLGSTNMFLAHEVVITDLLRDRNELFICFRSIAERLNARRPRPRWKTRLVREQQLRTLRTTLLGRMPGWTPPVAAVGPWRPISLERARVAHLETLRLSTSVLDGRGVVHAYAALEPIGDTEPQGGAELRVGDRLFPVEVEVLDGRWIIRVSAAIEDPRLWWPRTHGEPHLYDCALKLSTSAGPVAIDCGRIGFRKLHVDRSGGGVRFVVNDVPVFCRGACWTTGDVVSLSAPTEQVRRSLGLMADANANMVRVGGTGVYETEDFYRACDELGLMVWQDFMFASMDYASKERDFTDSVRCEARQLLARLARHPSVVAYCGGSELEQQAAMMGVPREDGRSRIFDVELAGLVDELAPGTPYWTSTPTGGALPFHVADGLSHYYGVGAYRRPLEDARLAGVRFSPECLGFANVPEPSNLRRLDPSGPPPPLSAAWKAGVPRDSGASWDFDDVRDHYLERLYDLDAAALRAEDPERYLSLSRLVTGEVMERVFSEWRHDRSGCGGGLVWCLQDLRPGAGWGVIDSDGEPKAAYHYLKRAWAPQCVRLLDRGLDGLLLLLINERPTALDARLDLTVLGRGSVRLETTSLRRLVPPRGQWSESLEGVLQRFLDPTHSYRFGPARVEAVFARLSDGEGRLLSESVFAAPRWTHDRSAQIDAVLERTPDGDATLAISSGAPLFGVRIEVEGARPESNYLTLEPDQPRRVRLRPERVAERSPRGFVEAANAALAKSVRVAS